MIFLYMLYALGARAFLFEIKLKSQREWLASKHKLFDTFLSCAFCNGFWCGLATYLIFNYEIFNIVEFVYFGLTVGALAYIQRLYTSQWDIV